MAELEITESDATIIDSELIIAEEDESFGEFKAMIEDQPMRNLYEFMQMGQLCDASLKIDDGSTILVHRNILAACSLYFRSIFTTPLHDKDLFHVNLTNVTREIVDEILTYVYMRKVNINKNNVYNLIIAADYLGISSLLEICCSVLESQLTSSNCIGIMKFAVCYFCTDLAKASETFILRNFTEVAFDNADLLRLDLNEFKAIVSHDELNVKHEELVWETILKWINYDEENRKQHVVTLMKTIRLGLLDTQFFLENVKDHPYVATVEESRPLIIDTLKFLYDLEMISYRSYECPTPELARPRIPHEVLFVIGGWSGGSPTNYMETYDTRADRWVKVEEVDPAGPRAYHGTAVVGFCIYVVGGFDGMDYFNSCRCFNAVARRWREVAPMHARRCYVSVTTLNDLIYAMGGYDGHHRQNTAEKYDYKSNQWTMISPMNMQRSDASACSLNDKIYITGGFNGQECMNSAECYDPEFNQWTIITGMRSRRSGVSCVAYHDFVYVVGGFNGISRMVSGERYDPATNLWSQIPDMYNPRSNFAIEVIDDMIFAIGGFNGVTTIYHVECYDEKANDWYEATDMTIYRSALSASAIVGLPNLHDYIHKHRDRLMEEKRLKMQMATLGSHRQIIGANINPNNNNNNHLNMTPPQPVIGAAAAQLVQILGEERPDIDLQELADELQHELDNEPFGLYPGPLEEPPDDDGELPDLFAADGQEIDAEIQPSALPIMGEIVLEEIIQGEIVQAEIVQGEIVQGEIVIPPIEIIATSLPSADDEMDYFYDFLNETDDSGEESEESSEEESTDSNSMEENNHYRDEEDNTGDGDSNLDNNSQNNESESEIRSLNSRQIISDTDSAVINDHQTTDHDTDSQNQTESDNNYYMIMPSITVHITRYIPPSEIIVHSESSMDENANSN